MIMFSLYCKVTQAQAGVHEPQLKMDTGLRRYDAEYKLPYNNN